MDAQEDLQQLSHRVLLLMAVANASMVRDAVRHLIESRGLSDQTREDIRVSREQFEAGESVSLDELE